MKMCLVMVTIIISLHTYRQLQHIQNCFVHLNGMTVSTEILNLHLWSDDFSNETEN